VRPPAIRGESVRYDGGCVRVAVLSAVVGVWLTGCQRANEQPKQPVERTVLDWLSRMPEQLLPFRNRPLVQLEYADFHRWKREGTSIPDIETHLLNLWFAETNEYRLERIVVALGTVGSSRSVPLLVEGLRRDLGGWETTAEALLEIGDRTAISFLEKQMCVTNERIRLATCFVLADVYCYGWDEAAAALKKAESDESAAIKDCAKKGIDGERPKGGVTEWKRMTGRAP